MMDPHIAIGMGSFFKTLLDPGANFDQSIERDDYETLARHYTDDDPYSRYDDAPEGSTAIFSIKGPMFKYGSWWTYGSEEIAAYIKIAAGHKNVSSIVLNIDSGGGLVSAIPPIIEAIRLARQMGKPVVAIVDLAGSAAYYIACECDVIMCSNSISSQLGSIGTMMEFWDIIPYYEELGLKHHEIYADQSSNKNEAFKLALEGKYDMIKKEMLNPLAIDFQNHVKMRRSGKLDESVPGILNGKVFFANDSIKNGLADEIGTMSDAIERAQQLAESRKFLSQT